MNANHKRRTAPLARRNDGHDDENAGGGLGLRDLHRGSVSSIANVALTAPYQQVGRVAGLPEQALGAIRGRMQPTRRPTPKELDALAAFEAQMFYPLRLRSLRDASDLLPRLPGFSIPVTNPAAVRGRASFELHCSRCHAGELDDRPADRRSRRSLRIPAVPPLGGLAATTASSVVNLTWSASVGATSYRVFRSLGGAFPSIACPSALGYSDTGLTNGTTYHYAVAAVFTGGADGGGASSESAEILATPPCPAPTYAGKISGAKSGAANVTWSWTSGGAASSRACP